MSALHRRISFLVCSLAAFVGCSSDGTTPTPTPTPTPTNVRVTQTNLVSDQAGVAAHTDPNLVNAWGIAIGPNTFFWIADNGTGVSTVYDGNGVPSPSTSPLVVTIPPPAGSPAGTTSAPTGLAFNSQSGIGISTGGAPAPATFLFSTEDGTVAGWNQTINARRAVTTADRSATGAIYKGLAVATNGGQPFTYATDFHNGKVEVFDAAFNPISSGFVTNPFTDPNLPAGYAPFGIDVINGDIFVTYALQDANKEDDVKGAGHGFVDEYGTDGRLIRRFASQGVLDSPWGMTIAPSSFGDLSGTLLIGNFGDGTIHAFDPDTGALRGTLLNASGSTLVIDGLWGLIVGNGANAGDTSKVYFTAGPNDEKHGLFGSLTPNL